MRSSRSLGDKGEAAAARFLRRLGYKLVARGERTPAGEIDLIAVDRRTVVFVEVKTRSSELQGRGIDAVDEDKQQRLSLAALAYLKRHDLLECQARFDVVEIYWPPERRRPEIIHFKHAFEPPGQGQMFS